MQPSRIRGAQYEHPSLQSTLTSSCRCTSGSRPTARGKCRNQSRHRGKQLPLQHRQPYSRSGRTSGQRVIGSDQVPARAPGGRSQNAHLLKSPIQVLFPRELGRLVTSTDQSRFCCRGCTPSLRRATGCSYGKPHTKLQHRWRAFLQDQVPGSATPMQGQHLVR